MAYEEALVSISQDAGADLSDQPANRYRGLTYGADGRVVLVDAADAVPAGVLQNEPHEGQPARLGISGVSKVRAGAAIAAGAQISFGADGRVVTAAAGSYVIGTAKEAAVAGDIISADISIVGAPKLAA